MREAIRKRKGTHDNLLRPSLGVGGYCLTKDPVLANWAMQTLFGLEGSLEMAIRSVNINDTMRRGDCGDAVTFLQERLTVLGFSVSADGQFGPGTERVVKDFQTSRGLTADGIVGAETWAALVEGGIGD
mgnify:CR=1 FL=1